MPQKKRPTIQLALKVFALATLVSGAAFVAGTWILLTQHDRLVQSQRSRTIEQLGRIRANIESTLNGSLTLTQGLAATVFAHGRLSDKEFQDIARQLAGGRDDVRNLAIAYGTILSQVYPIEGNQAALGMDYRNNPAQWPAVEQAIRRGTTVVDGPLQLVQGGIGVISRTPVSRAPRPGEPPEYFGLISMVVSLTTLLDRAGLTDESLEIDASLSDDGHIFHGNPTIVTHNPVKLEISFPGGMWLIHAVPKSGWPKEWWRFDPTLSGLAFALALAVSLTSFYAAFAWMHRLRLYDSLCYSEERYRHLLDTAPAAIVLHRHGRIIFTNKEALRLMEGAQPEDLLGRPIHDLIHQDYHPVVGNRLTTLRKAGDDTPQIRLKLVTLDGKVISADVSSSAVMLDGELAILAIVIDTTRSVQAEAQLQAILDDLQRSNDELRQFISAASHDLQEPLRQVATHVQMLERRFSAAIGAEGKDFIAFAVDGVLRMRKLLQDLATYAQIRAAGAALTPIQSAETVTQALSKLTLDIERLRAQVDRTALPMIHGDGAQIERLFLNLLENALRYGRMEVPPRIMVTAHREGAMHHFCVSDNGIGIAPEYQDCVFNVFTRLHSIGHIPGTGFGLAICRRIVERHGGRIWIHSVVNEGTNVHFTLPAA